MFRADQGLEAWKNGSWKNTATLAAGLTLGTAERDWMGRSQLWAVIWPVFFGETVRNGMEMQHILLRFARDCICPGPWIQLVALGSRKLDLGTVWPRGTQE